MSKFKEDKIAGGLAAGMTLNDIAEKHGVSIDMLVAEFKKGIGVEMEHTTDREVAKEIALDHLFEDPKYYTKLIDMEKGMNESAMGELDIMAKQSSNFKDFVKTFQKEFPLIQIDREAIKWLEGIYNDRTNESVNEESSEEILKGLREMAMGDLERIADYANMISDRMNEGQELSSWMYSQITLAVDQLNSVHDTMDGKDGIKESVNEAPAAKIKNTITKKEWSKIAKFNKHIGMDGTHYVMKYDDKIGTYLQAVKLVDEVKESDCGCGCGGVTEGGCGTAKLESKDGLERVAAGLPQTEEEPLNEWKAEEVLQQLGGRKFIAMTGAKNFVKNDPKKQIVFKIGGGAKNGINYVRVTLTSMDLYNMEFLKARGTDLKVVASEKGVYNDQLQQMFTKHTGMNTKL
jgi:hypothetical protein